MANQNEKMLNNLNSLKKSPLFNLFLSSKELFHTNFLKWYFEISNPEVIRSVFEGIIDNNINIGTIECLREKRHVDLTINIYDEKSRKLIQKIIIENKFKRIH